jgi:hypothetical protein
VYFRASLPIGEMTEKFCSSRGLPFSFAKKAGTAERLALLSIKTLVQPM